MRVLVLGAGQLARMMALEAIPLNIEVQAFDVRSNQIVDPINQQVLGEGLQQALRDADVVTAEFEHIPQAVLEPCEQSGKFLPGSRAILTGGDRRIEKALLQQAGVASAAYAEVHNKAELEAAVQQLGLPLVLKSALEGYDGKGQWRLKQMEQLDAVWTEVAQFLKQASKKAKQGIVAEQFIPFDYEVSLVGARGQDGSTVFYPLTENHHVNGVLSVSLARSEHPLQTQAEQMFQAIADELDYVGVLAIEFFVVGEQLLVNELAPRVHNSGHWTQQGADTSQFANHIRAVCGLPLGASTVLRPTLMVNILGLDQLPDALLGIAGLHLHWYGKTPRPGRKMGHINLSADTTGQLAKRFEQLIALLPEEDFPELELLLDKI
ncbi:5-(carboxyamino)imidazole ribonucleotide synthase [Alkalimonas sp. NCh-2]|uniref:5-(carboxyamino)imidazole ribonucleotide synthase n=1 Tax=Alkalimonas sp. NCh-2 TaxID=3144846 RepID=UPI0031F6043A